MMQSRLGSGLRPIRRSAGLRARPAVGNPPRRESSGTGPRVPRPCRTAGAGGFIRKRSTSTRPSTTLLKSGSTLKPRNTALSFRYCRTSTGTDRSPRSISLNQLVDVVETSDRLGATRRIPVAWLVDVDRKRVPRFRTRRSSREMRLRGVQEGEQEPASRSRGSPR